MIALPYRWGVVWIYLLMLLFLSSIPGDPQQSAGIAITLPFLPFPILNDKVLHLMFYFPLGWLLALTTLRWWKVLIIGALMAALDECYQGLIPGRVPDVMDWIMDMAGILSGWIVEYRLKGRRRSQA
jgi:VanZ family protein